MGVTSLLSFGRQGVLDTLSFSFAMLCAWLVRELLDVPDIRHIVFPRNCRP